MYWLGTDKSNQQWINPAIVGAVKLVSNAKLQLVSDNISSVVGNKCARFCTEDFENSWVMLDLMDVRIKPTHYILQHYSLNNSNCLRNWYLEASNNSSNGYDGDWVKLSIHIDDKSLKKAGDTHKWSLSEMERDNKLYSQFRLYQWNFNSSNTNHLAFGKVEIYGIAVNENNDEKTNFTDSKSFVYQAGDDKNGLLYYLGTFGDITKPYRNPSITNQVLLSSTPIHSHSKQLSFFLERKNGNVYTESFTGSYVAFNLKNVKLKLTQYTLKNNENNKNILRNWHLEGSNDGIEWILLKKHINDTSLNKANQTYTWDVDDTEKYFSQFRIIMTGYNSNSYKNPWTLSCSGIEFYGEAINCQFVKQKTDDNRQFIYEYDHDKNGLLYYLGTSNGSNVMHKNPAKMGAVILSSSSLDERISLSSLIGRLYKDCWTQSDKLSFMAVQILDIEIMLTKYTLTNNYNNKNTLRSWDLQASTDGTKWIVISKHADDTQLKQFVHTWDVNCNTYFSHFRLVITDKNYDDNWSLACSGIELYGTTRKITKDKAIVTESLNFDDNLLMDVYSVHKCFLYVNYAFKHHTKEEYIKCLQQTPYFDTAIYQYHLEFDPYFLIKDDIFEVMKYFFATSRYISNMKQQQKHREGQFTLSIFIKGSNINCIFDENIKYVSTIKDIPRYIRRKLNPYNQKMQKKSVQIFHVNKNQLNIATIENLIKSEYHYKDDENALIIVDRIADKDDLLYLTTYNEFENLNKFRLNYFIGMEYIIDQNEIKAHFNYGRGNKFRFYPETLYTIIPRLFFKPTNIASWKHLFSLHENSFKHGFCLELNDIWFNKMYKQITSYDHISVQCNRNFVKVVNDEIDLYHETNIQANCHSKNISPIEDCDYILYIIKSLRLYKTSNHTITDKNESNFKVEFLAKCQEHIIRVHRFCCDYDERMKLQKFVTSIIGECPIPVSICSVVNNHASRRREITTNKSSTKDHIKYNKITISVLTSILESLHSYLSHHDKELYRLRGNNQNAKLRFSSSRETQMSKLDRTEEKKKSTNADSEGKTEIEKFIAFVKENGIDETTKLQKLYSWVIQNEYDSDAIFEDLEDGKKGSNLYKCLWDRGIGGIFELLMIKYVYSQNNVVCSINFGVSVLTWLSFGDIPTYSTLKHELLSNKHSTIDNTLYDEYVHKCLIKIHNNPQEHYLLNEMLSLKIYTDTTEFQSHLRKAFWSTSKLQHKRDFYWWAMTLYKTMLYHGNPICRASSESNAPVRLYHGLNNIFIINDKTPLYHGPISTTSADSVASRFSENKGIIWNLKTSYSNPFKCVIGIDVDWVSAFGNESEILLYNQYLPIASTINFSDTVEMKVAQLIQQLKIFKTQIVSASAFYTRIGFAVEKEWIPLIRKHRGIFDTVKYQPNKESRIVLHRIVEELKLTQLSSLLKIYTSKFVVDKHLLKVFGIHIYRIQISVDHGNSMRSIFTDCKYKVTNVKDKNESILNYPPAFNAMPNMEYVIYISNPKIFGVEDEIYLQKITPVKVYTQFINSIQLKPNCNNIIWSTTFSSPYNKTISNSKFMVTSGNQSNTKHFIYQFKNTSDFQLIIPFSDRSYARYTIYVQTNTWCSEFIPIKEIVVPFKHLQTQNKVQYLFRLLTNNNLISDPEMFYQQIGFSIDEHCIEEIAELRANYDVNVFRRFVDELRISQLEASLIFLESNMQDKLQLFDNKVIQFPLSFRIPELLRQQVLQLNYLLIYDEITSIFLTDTDTISNYDQISGFNLVIPFERTTTSCTVYIQSTTETHFTFVKSFIVKQQEVNKIDYLCSVLKHYNSKITNVQKFLKIVNIDILSQDIAAFRKSKKLYEETPMNNIVLKRLVNELNIHQLSNDLIIWSSQFEIIWDVLGFLSLKWKTSPDILNQYTALFVTENEPHHTLDVMELRAETTYKILLHNDFGSYPIQKNVARSAKKRKMLEDITNIFDTHLVLTNNTKIILHRNYSNSKMGISDTTIQQILKARFMIKCSYEVNSDIINEEKDDEVLKFTDISNIEIPLPAYDYVCSFHLFISPKQCSKFKLFKTFHLTKFTFANKLIIDRDIKLSELCNDKHHALQIFGLNDITINENIVMDSDSRCSSLKYESITNKYNDTGKDGGIIEIISAQTVINNGTIMANNANGGRVTIRCAHFINNGTISGLINIECIKYENNTQSILPSSQVNIVEEKLNT
eukprot:320710_1